MARGNWWALSGALALALLVAACGGGDKTDSGASSSTQGPGAGVAPQGTAVSQQATAKVRRGGNLTVAMEQNPKTFDAVRSTDVYSNYVNSNVYDTLVKVDENLEPKPYLAESIEHPDELTYIFKLRKGVKFHDGTDLDAAAVKFSVDRLREYKAGPGYADAQYITESTVVDPLTYKIVLREPFSPFLNLLDGRLGQIVSTTAVKKYGEEDYGLHPTGSGPFKFVEWKNDSYVKLVKNENYWRMGADDKPLPYLDSIEWRIITEPTTRLTALQTGDVLISPVRDADLAVVKADTNLTWKQQASFGWSSMLLTLTKPPFDNKALRQAVAYAIDREEIVKAIYEGNAVPGTGPLSPQMAWAKDEAYKGLQFDLAKAKEKLIEGGKPNGFEFTGWYSAGNSLTEQLAQLTQAQLAKVGIKMNIEFADFNGVVIPKVKAGEPGAYSIGLNCGPDPDGCIAGRFQTDNGFNYMKYSNPKVDELIKAERNTTDRAKRAAAFKEMVPIITEDAPVIFTTFGVERYVGNKKVQGWYLAYKYTRGYSEYWLSE